MPLIDSCIDAVLGFKALSFLDAYSRYNQILDQTDEEKTTYTTGWGTYYYKAMPFDLKNTWETYQQMVSKIFEGLISTFIEAYIDDTIFKSIGMSKHVLYLRHVFDRL